MNAEVDFVDPSTTDLSAYKLIVVPALYAAADAEIERLNAFAEALGGHLLYTFKSGFSDENVKVRYTTQPGLIAESAGVQYNQFALPEGVSLEDDPYHVGPANNSARWWMELLTPTTATTVAQYHHPVWGKYAAIVRNNYGKGEVTYVGFMPTDALVRKNHGRLRQTRRPLGPAAIAPLSNHHAQRRISRRPLCSLPPELFRHSRSSNLRAGIRKKPAFRRIRSAKQHRSLLPAWGVAIIEESAQRPPVAQTSNLCKA